MRQIHHVEQPEGEMKPEGDENEDPDQDDDVERVGRQEANSGDRSS